MIIILVGIPGSGKSTVLKEISTSYPEVQVINYGTTMVQEASLKGIDRDALRKLPIHTQQEIGRLAALKIAQESQGITIVDTHACIKTDVGYCPGIPLKILEALNPKALVMLYCSPELIIQRRRGDVSRNRDADEIDVLTEHQTLTREFLAAASTLTGAVLCILENGPKPISANVLPFIKLIKSLESSTASNFLTG